MTMRASNLFSLFVPALVAGAFLCALKDQPLHTLRAETIGVIPYPFEAGEDKPGGKATSRKSYKNKNAFSHSSGNLSFKNELTFKVGNGIFRKLWVSSPSSTKSSDGLGPLFNARSCQRCHLKDGRGHPPTANWPADDQVSMFLRLSVPPKTKAEAELIASGKALVIPEPTYGGQLQDLSIQGHAGEGRMHITYKPVEVKLADGETVVLRQPHYKVTELGYGALSKEVRLSPRVTPQMIGLGLLELIPTADIVALEDADDRDRDGISGRANRVWSLETDKLMLGRFGWKAGMPTVREQSAAAFAGDLGLSTNLHLAAFGDCTARQSFCRNAPHGAKPGEAEVSDELLDLVTFYAQNLAVPRRRKPKSETVLKGKRLFHQIGCAHCHQPRFKTGVSKKNPHLSKQVIWPYSDLLLHDMGEGLADNSPEGRANGREWRTPPLWGIGLTKTVSGHSFFLHDGRARSLTEAILWHGGEGEASKDRFRSLSTQERAWLIEFISSL